MTRILRSRGVLRHGAKKHLQSQDVANTVTVGDLDDVFEPGALESLLDAYEGDYRGLLD